MGADTYPSDRGMTRQRRLALALLCARLDVDGELLEKLLRDLPGGSRKLALRALENFAMWVRAKARAHLTVCGHTVMVWASRRSMYRAPAVRRAAMREQAVVLAFLQFALEQAGQRKRSGRSRRVNDSGSGRRGRRALARLSGIEGRGAEDAPEADQALDEAARETLRELLEDVEEEDRAMVEGLLEKSFAGGQRA